MTYLVSLNNLSSLYNVFGKKILNKYLIKIITGHSRVVSQSSNVFTVTLMMKNSMILLLVRAANFEPFHCIPVKSSFSFRLLASTACAVISNSEEVPIQARNFTRLRYHGFLNMGEGTAQNVSEFQSQINPMNSVMTVHHNDNFI